VPAGSFEVADDGHRLFFATSKPGRCWFTFSYTDDVNDLISELTTLQRKLAEQLSGTETDSTELKEAYDAVATITRQLVDARIIPHSIVHELVITGTVPDDEHGDDNTEPVIPDGRYRLALLSRAEALKLSDRDGLTVVATIYREIASLITRGELKSRPDRFGEAITKATGQLLAARLSPAQVTLWQPWGGAVSRQINTLQQDGQIVSDGDLVTAYEEIAIGLESISDETKPDPRPQPEPKPAKPIAWVVVIEETADRTPSTSAVISDLKWWQSLEARNIKWRHYDEDSDDGATYAAAISGMQLPVVLLLATDGTVIDKLPLPATTAELERRITR